MPHLWDCQFVCTRSFYLVLFRSLPPSENGMVDVGQWAVPPVACHIHVLSEKFTQDIIEFYFGLKRTYGQRSDNPILFQFEYNDNAIQAQRSLCRVEGNTKGWQEKQKYLWYHIDEEALPKRKKQL